MWHFNPISAAAASRLSDKHKRVRSFSTTICTEEAGHEEWVLNDLEAIGVGREQARAEVPSTITKALCGYNYWTADRGPPCASLGMMYSLEVIASVYGGTFASAMTEALLLEGDKGISFISSHASMDTEHLRELKDVNAIEDDDAGRDHRVDLGEFPPFHAHVRSRMNEGQRAHLVALMSRPYRYIRFEWSSDYVRCGSGRASSRPSAIASQRWASCSEFFRHHRKQRARASLRDDIRRTRGLQFRR